MSGSDKIKQPKRFNFTYGILDILQIFYFFFIGRRLRKLVTNSSKINRSGVEMLTDVVLAQRELTEQRNELSPVKVSNTSPYAKACHQTELRVLLIIESTKLFTFRLNGKRSFSDVIVCLCLSEYGIVLVLFATIRPASCAINYECDSL